MYEEAQQANTRLKGDLEKVRNELVSTKKKFEEALKVKFYLPRLVGPAIIWGERDLILAKSVTLSINNFQNTKIYFVYR